MAEKRKDNKGRVLRNGESQRKDGKYELKYVDRNGVRRSEYSWKLVPTDKVPKGKRSVESLREIEKRIKKDLDDGIDSYNATRTTLNEFYDDYINGKYELKESTRNNYKYMYKKYVSESIGKVNIADIKYSDIKTFYGKLLNEGKFKPNSLENIHTILHPVFTVAVRDGYIRTNPTDGVLNEIKKSYNWEKPKRHALTRQEQENFVEFLNCSKKYRKWKPIFTVFLGTGLRVGELIGLTWDDCDFENNEITVNRSVLYRPCEDGKCKSYVSTPKTQAGCRTIPMLSGVKSALLEERLSQRGRMHEFETVDGVSGFVFTNRFGRVFRAVDLNRVLERIGSAYNNEEEAKAKEENREPELLPHFTVHNLRHTFCTRYCEVETNLKAIQEIMGHADISTTMDVYNEATREVKRQSFDNLEGKIKIG